MANQDEKKQVLEPELRFPEFGGDGVWKTLKIGDLGKVSMCKRILKHQTSESGEIPFYKIGTFGKTPDVFISREIFTEFKEKFSYPKVGDILISAAGTIGRCVVFDGEDAYFQDSNIVWIANTEKQVTNAFLFYCYLNVQWTTDDNTIPRLYNKNLRNIKLLAPAIPEQQKIADCLGSLDDLIAAHTAKLDALQDHKKGLLQQLFPAEGQTTPTLRFPEFQNAGPWRLHRVSEVLKSAVVPVDVVAEASYREIGIRSHGKGVFHKEPVAGKSLGNKRVFQVIENALVLNIVFAWERAIATTSEEEAGMIASHRFPMYVPKLNRCDVRFMKLFFLTPAGTHLLSVASPGGAGRNRTLGKKEFEKLKFLLPERQEQICIANTFCNLDSLITAETDQIAAFNEHKKGLMQRLFPNPELSKA